jgi:hypothetical protein
MSLFISLSDGGWKDMSLFVSLTDGGCVDSVLLKQRFNYKIYCEIKPLL